MPSFLFGIPLTNTDIQIHSFIMSPQVSQWFPRSFSWTWFLPISLLIAFSAASCKRDELTAPSHFPAEVEAILVQNCATEGCHTAQGADLAGGLNLETWEGLFKGTRGGSAVVPYAPEMSYLLYSINTDSTVGPVLTPTMPFGQPSLSKADYQVLADWIAAGARNHQSKERFPPDPARRKWYVANRGCDWVAVFDAESHQIMRYIKVGTSEAFDEEPYAITTSPDGLYWYLTLAANSPFIEKYSSVTDEKVGTIQLGHNIWNNMAITSDGRWAFVVSGPFQQVAVVDLRNMAVVGNPQLLGSELQGVAIHPTQHKVYLTLPGSNSLLTTTYDPANGQTGAWQALDLVQNYPPTLSANLTPYDIVFSPDGSQYYVSCFESRELRIFDADNDSLLAAVSLLAASPTNIAISPVRRKIFIACPDEAAAWQGNGFQIGAIAIVDMDNYSFGGLFFAGYQAHGIAVDDANGWLVAASRNLSQYGPSQHHPSACTGRNGSLQLIDLDNYLPLNHFKAELSVDPFEVAILE